MQTVLSMSLRLIQIGLILIFIGSCSEKEPEIKIGVLINSASNPGRSLDKTLQLVEHQINTDPRFKRKPIRFIKRDIGSTQESALAALYNLLRDHHIAALVGPTTSQLTMPIAIVANAHQIPLISPSASNIEVTKGKPFIFTAVFNNELQSRALADFVTQDLAVSQVGVLYDKSNAYSKTLALSFKTRVESQNKLTYAYGYVGGEKNFETYLTKMKTAGIEVLFLPNFDQDISLQTATMANMNWQPIIVGSDSWHPQNYVNRPVVSQTYFTHQWGVAVGGENVEARKFIDAFTQFHNLEPTIVSALSYDALNILLNAVHSAGGDPLKIRQSIASIDQFKGVSGQYSFRNSNVPNKPVFLFAARQNEIKLYREIRND